MSAATITRLNGVGDQTSIIFGFGSGLGAASVSANLQTPTTATPVGSGAGQVSKPYVYSGIVTAASAGGSPFTVNMSTGTDQYGNTIGFVHQGRLHVAHTGSTGKIVVGAGTHPVMGSDQVTLAPGEFAVIDKSGFGYQVASGAVSGVEPVEAMVVADTSGGNGSGGVVISYMGINTSSVTYSATAATFIASLNAAFNASFGSGNIVASGTTLANIIITGTAGNYQYNQFGGHFVSTITGSGFTINGQAGVGTTTTTTAGLAPISGEQDTLTITADCGAVNFSLIALGR